MKNVQVIDGARNSEYAIFAFTEEEFLVVFNNEGQDIEFEEDLADRIGDKRLGELLIPVWERRVDKKIVNGIHGTLFYDLEFKKEFYPNKKESDLNC